MGLWEDVEGVISFGQFLIRSPLSLFLIFQSDAGGAAASPSSSHFPSPQYSLFVICSVFQKHSLRVQRVARQEKGLEARVCLLVDGGVVVHFPLEFCEDIGQGLVVVLHLLMVGAALGGATGADECCHAPKDPPESSLLSCGQAVPMMVDEKQVPHLLLFAPVARLCEDS